MTCAVKSAPGVEMAILERHDWSEKIHTNTTYTSTLWHYQVLQAHWCIHGVDACQRVNTCVCLKRWLAPEAQSSAAPHALQENYSGTFLAKQNCHEKKIYARTRRLCGSCIHMLNKNRRSVPVWHTFASRHWLQKWQNGDHSAVHSRNYALGFWECRHHR